MKKLVAVLISLLLAAMLCGCGGSRGISAQDAANEAERKAGQYLLDNYSYAFENGIEFGRIEDCLQHPEMFELKDALDAMDTINRRLNELESAIEDLQNGKVDLDIDFEDSEP